MAPKPEKTEAQLAAEKQEAERRAALSQEERDEEDRRAKLTDAERDEEDLADLEAEQIAENDAARGGPSGLSGGATSAQTRAALVRRIQNRNKAQREKEATVEVTIARGREVYTEAGQTVPHKGGATIMVTPAEEATLRAAGHLVNPATGTVTEPTGPRVFQESGLIEGHGAGQGAKPSGKSGK